MDDDGAGGAKPPEYGSLDFVRQEYFFLQTSVEDYQKQSLDIKKLSLGLCAGIAFLQGAAKADLYLSLASIFFLALSFWLLDWLWKGFQRNHYPRLDEIETALSGELKFPPRISVHWRGPVGTAPVDPGKAGAGARAKRLEWKTLWWPQVFVPHLPIAVVSLLAILARIWAQTR